MSERERNKVVELSEVREAVQSIVRSQEDEERFDRLDVAERIRWVQDNIFSQFSFVEGDLYVGSRLANVLTDALEEIEYLRENQG